MSASKSGSNFETLVVPTVDKKTFNEREAKGVETEGVVLTIFPTNRNETMWGVATRLGDNGGWDGEVKWPPLAGWSEKVK